MALKFISLVNLLPTRGDGGVSGDNGRRANSHAVVLVPPALTLRSLLPYGGGEREELEMTGGDAQSQYPYGFQATDPTAPTDPTCFKATASPYLPDDVEQPIRTDLLIDAAHALDLAQGSREFKTAMNANEFHAGLDNGPDALSTHELAGWNVEPPVVPDLMAWPARAAAYYAHHFNCPTCIAAGRGLEYAERCPSGLLLWNAYEDQFIADGECITPLFFSNSLPLQECHDK